MISQRILKTGVPWSSGRRVSPHYSGIRTTEGKLGGIYNKKKNPSLRAKVKLLKAKIQYLAVHHTNTINNKRGLG